MGDFSPSFVLLVAGGIPRQSNDARGGSSMRGHLLLGSIPLASALACTVLVTAPVMAQFATDGASPDAGNVAQGSPGGSSPSGSASGTNLQEVIVTATKQAEPLSKVPITISAYTEQELDVAGAKSMADIAALTPGVDFTGNGYYNGLQTNITIRGISQAADTAATVGVYINDVPVQARVTQTSTLGNAYPLVFDLDRVEILQGPQGTLFGSGAEAGAVRFITPQPSLTTYSEYGRAEVGDTVDGTPSYEAGAAVGGPIVEGELGFRVSAWGRTDGGWVDNKNYETGVVDANDNWRNSGVFSAAFTYSPTSAVTITPSVFYQNIYVNDTSQYWVGFSNPDAGRFVNENVLLSPGNDHFILPSLKITADLSWADLTSISSYFYRRGSTMEDGTEFDSEVWALVPYPILPGQKAPEPYQQGQNVTTEELRLSSKQGEERLSWVAGLFYNKARQTDGSQVIDTFLPQLIYDTFGESIVEFLGFPLYKGLYSIIGWDNQSETQEAAYAHVDYSILDSLRLGVGLRVDRDRYDFYNIYGGPILGTGTTLNSFSGSESSTPVTPEFNLNYQVTPDDLAYATVAKGYRIGGVNGPIPSNPPCDASLKTLGLSSAPTTYQPDSVWNYEVGTKDKFFDGRTEINLSVFYEQWRNTQQFVALPACGGVGFNGNLGTAHSQGVNLALQTHIVGGLQLGLAVGYTNAYYTQTIGPPSGQIVTAGETLGQTPWVVTATPEYDFQVGDYSVYLRAQDEYHSFNSGNWPGNNPNSISYDPAIPLPPETNLLDVRAGVVWGPFDLSLFVNNALNSHPTLLLFHALPGDPLFTASTFQPLTAGLTLIYRH
jgi:iron complex outermembrane recepter protein